MAEGDLQRLFFALWPEAVVRQRLEALLRRIPADRGRPVHPADLHLTLHFLGDVPAQRHPCLVEAAEAALAEGTEPVELPLQRLGYWRRPRILWVAPELCPASLGILVQSLGERLTRCGYTPERREFAPHITLARKCSAGLLRVLEPFEEIRWSARELALVASLPVSRPPRYRVLHSWPL